MYYYRIILANIIIREFPDDIFINSVQISSKMCSNVIHFNCPERKENFLEEIFSVLKNIPKSTTKIIQAVEKSAILPAYSYTLSQSSSICSQNVAIADILESNLEYRGVIIYKPTFSSPICMSLNCMNRYKKLPMHYCDSCGLVYCVDCRSDWLKINKKIAGSNLCIDCFDNIEMYTIKPMIKI